MKIGELFYKLNLDTLTAEVEPISKWTNESYQQNTIIIPPTINPPGKTFRVTSIGKNAFSKCSNLRSIHIPDSIENIGESAFYDCQNLETVIIPEGVMKIGEGAFGHCHNLRSITLPDSITSIGDCAFIDCYSLTSIKIPDKITRIEDWTFIGCKNLKSITFPTHLISVGTKAFRGCESLTSLVFPNSLETVEADVVDWYCKNLKSVRFGENITHIDKDAFRYCESLQKVYIPETAYFKHISDFRAAFPNITIDYIEYTNLANQSTSNPTTNKTSNIQLQSNQHSKHKSGCYIATAVYGSYDCPEVWTLRRYRDNVLDNSWYGKLFIRAYYAISPTLVKCFGATNWFRNLFIEPLNKWVTKLNKWGFENTPYKDKY